MSPLTTQEDIEELMVLKAAPAAGAWPVAWSAIAAGALTALALALLFGLAGVALGAHQLAPGEAIRSWRAFGFGAFAWSVLGAFFAFVAGGWVSGKLARLTQAEVTALHGAMAWLVGVPLLWALLAAGAGAALGPWYGALGAPVGPPPAGTAEQAAAAMRHGALATLTALLLGLIGSVLGGWLASGQPMTLRPRQRASAAPGSFSGGG